MKYIIDNYTFYSSNEYEAAKRDKARLQRLERHGISDVEAALGYRRQIKALGIHFESRLGRDFEANINRLLFSETADSPSEPDKERDNSTPAPSGSRKLFLVPLYVTAALLAVVIGVYFGKEYISGKNMAVVQAQAQSGKQTGKPRPSEQGKPKEILPRFRELSAKNPDFVGWLTIPDTVIDYPVMFRSGDNDFYLEHNFDGAPDQNGLLVLDKRCASKGEDVNNLIHGHSMRSGAMFGTLLRYANESYFREHPRIFFSTLYEEQEFDVVGVIRSSVYNEDTDDFKFYDYIEIDSEGSFNEYVQGIKSQSLYDTGITAQYGDRLITLSTCEYTKENGRLVVVARCKK